MSIDPSSEDAARSDRRPGEAAWRPSAHTAAATVITLSLALAGCNESPRTTPTMPATIEPALAKAPGPSAASVPAQVGVWGMPFPWGGSSRALGIHMHLLPDGKVLTWGHSGQPSVWDPAVSSQFVTVPSPSMLFCAGHAFLADGRLLVTGGHDDDLGDEVGVKTQHTFDYRTQSWSVETDLAYGRWYPTSTTLPNGDVLTIGGTDSARRQLPIPEIWSNGASRALPGASWDFTEATASYYPRTFVAPDGKVFYAGEEQQTRWVDVAGSGSVTPGPPSNFGRRDYGSAVSYDAGKIMLIGGGYTPTSTVEVIDLNQSNPSWRYVAPMANPRRQLNATLLADGTVFVNGGTSVTGFTEESGALYAAELWNTSTETWKTLASGRVIRVYHSAALLLADGRVLVAGGGEGSNATAQLTAEIYSPPYLYNGKGALATRPTINSAPTSVAYGQSFFVGTSQPKSISKVHWIRLGSVTHAFNQSQLFSRLTFTLANGGVSVRAPSSRTASPPGHYLLFVFDGNGVPSIARIVRLG